MKEDRRIQRSRQLLHEALFALVLERGYEEVTIKDIVERANVSRSTFYLHYTSKEDLLTDGIDDLRAHLSACQQAALTETGSLEERCLAFSPALFEHAQTFREVYRVLVTERGSAIIMSRLRALLSELVGRDLSVLMNGHAGAQVPRSVMVQFVVGALFSVLTWWMERDDGTSAAEADRIFRRLTLPSILAATGQSG